LPAWIIRIDRHEHPGQPARLPGVHENPRRGPHEIGRWRCPIDQEEAIGKFRRFQSHPVVEHMQLSCRCRRHTIVRHDDKIGGKLPRTCRGDAAEQKPGNNKQAQPVQVRGQDIDRGFGHRRGPLQEIHRIERRTKSSADQAIWPDRRYVNKVRSRSCRDPWSMIRKSGYRFSEKSCSNKEIERDDDSKKRHPAPGDHSVKG
jgi:hypothetical protein